MGSLVGISFSFTKQNEGIVYNLLVDIFNELTPLEDIRVAYCYDESKTQYIYKKLSEIGDFEIINSKILNIRTKVQVNNNMLEVLIDKSILNNSFSIAIFFEEEGLYKCFNNLDGINKFIDEFVINMYDRHKFTFACSDNNVLCDHEYDEVINGEYDKYSICYIPKNDKLEIYRQDWDLDGCTPRT